MLKVMREKQIRTAAEHTMAAPTPQQNGAQNMMAPLMMMMMQNLVQNMGYGPVRGQQQTASRRANPMRSESTTTHDKERYDQE